MAIEAVSVKAMDLKVGMTIVDAGDAQSDITGTVTKIEYLIKRRSVVIEVDGDYADEADYDAEVMIATAAGDGADIKVKHPNVVVQLIGNDGNSFMIIGLVVKALKRAGVPKEEIDEFTAEAMAGDYTDLLNAVQRWVGVH
jgi:hypothetical protein